MTYEAPRIHGSVFLERGALEMKSSPSLLWF